MLADRFRARFGGAPDVVASAPGRVNLIGEHTDYNDGFVLPMAIDRRVWVAVRRRADDATDIDAQHDGGRYVRAVVEVLRRTHGIPGFDVLVEGDVPVGAGLASSAALELAAVRAIAELAEIAWDARTMARLAQRAENEIVGVQCGIMDQLAVACGRRDAALLLDCRSLEIEQVALPAEVAIVVMDTGVRRALAASGYNDRREACERAARAFGVRALRDATPAMLEKAATLDADARDRARHVIEENARPRALAAALRAGDFQRAGEIVNDSHTSLRDLYAVSSDHLDRVCALAREHPACYGARLTGAGFGGCAIALVRASDADAFIGAVQPRYEAATYKKSEFFVARADDGARLEP